MKLYVMMDRVSGTFGNVFEDFNDESVRRNFKATCERGDMPRYYVKDTMVFRLGEFVDDSVEPKIIPCIPKVVCRGDEYEYTNACEEDLSPSDCSDC